MKRTLNLWLLAVVMVCGVSLWIGRGAPLPRLHGQTPDQGVAALPAPADGTGGVQLVVLNGTGVQGLARDFGLLLGHCGLAPVRYGNAAPQDYARSFLVNRRLDRDRAEALGDFLGGVDVLEEYDGRGTEDLVLVLGADHARLRSALDARLP